MSNQPVYRRGMRPVPPGEHPNWCRCAGCRADIARFEGRQGAGVLIAAAVVVVAAVIGFWPARVWHGTTPSGAWRWDIHSTAACLIWWGLMLIPFLAVTIGGKRGRRPRRPACGMPAVEQLPPPPASVTVPACRHRTVLGQVCLDCGASVACRHLHAVKVASAFLPDVVYHCWCPDCDPECGTPLPAGFRRPCCGTEPETPHLRNCTEGGPV